MGLRFCISNKLPGDAVASGPWTTLKSRVDGWVCILPPPLGALGEFLSRPPFPCRSSWSAVVRIN